MQDSQTPETDKASWRVPVHLRLGRTGQLLAIFSLSLRNLCLS